MKTPTTDTIRRATEKADRQEFDYTVTITLRYSEQVFGGGVWASVQHKADKTRCYLVDVFANGRTECTCPAHQRDGYCKHCALIELHLSIDAREAEAAELEAGRCEVGEAKF